MSTSSDTPVSFHCATTSSTTPPTSAIASWPSFDQARVNRCLHQRCRRQQLRLGSGLDDQQQLISTHNGTSWKTDIVVPLTTVRQPRVIGFTCSVAIPFNILKSRRRSFK